MQMLNRRQFLKMIGAGVATALPLPIAKAKPQRGSKKPTDKIDGHRNPYVCCHFIFKSKRCGYAGPDRECKLLYNDCKNKGNQMNFGGFSNILR